MIFLAFLIFFKFAKITSFRFIPDSHFLYQPSTMSKSVMAKYVKERVVLSALLSRYTKLVPTSEKSYLTNCFYHEDKTPSMMVNDVPASSPYYYCFSCGESGDFIKFLTQKATNVSSTTILQSSYYALSAGKTVEEWIEAFEKKYGIIPSQHSLIPRATLANRNRVQKIIAKANSSIQRDPDDDIPISDEEALKFEGGIVSDTLSEAKKFFTTRLIMDTNAYFVRSYLKERGISVETAMKFELGYAPTIRLLKKAQSATALDSIAVGAKSSSGSSASSTAPIISVSNSLLKQSVGEVFKKWQIMRGMTLTDWMLKDLPEGDVIDQKLQYMVHAGLTVNGSKYADDSFNKSSSSWFRRQNYYDRFRNRLMIPIRNQEGKVIGFGGRELPLPRNLMTEEELQQLDTESKLKKPIAKYINSPSSVVFTKKKVLFGIDTAAPHCEKEGYVIMVEGYFDVISCYQAGVRNVVASMGTSVTLEQLLLAANLTSSRTVILLLDNDDAGQKAMQRAKGIVDKHHEKVYRLLRPDGDTLDEEEIQRKHRITLKRASIDDILPYISKYNMETQLGKVYGSESKKLKDCADICEVFPASTARKIIRQIAKTAVSVLDEDQKEDKKSLTQSSSDKNLLGTQQSYDEVV